MLKPVVFLVVALAANLAMAKVGDISVKFTNFDCMKEEESKFCHNISCQMKPLNRTATMFSGLCVEPLHRNFVMVTN